MKYYLSAKGLSQISLIQKAAAMTDTTFPFFNAQACYMFPFSTLRIKFTTPSSIL
jgi:hypothetical protein